MPHNVSDMLCGHVWVLVFPERQERPADAFKSFSISSVSYDVPLDFRLPIGAIGCWLSVVLWTPMPETAMNLDGNFGPTEDNIGLETYFRQRLHVKSVA
ncbi:hypothetical protein UK23_10560 [Lentzea aerocolonigenes]|uniref:Uncharacterized protein n=1 Tax=Lentzea aerocolonigenes TaxID=68170 RepID=A0A0F0H6G3_LENAE|nr:hypothetical protein UK23_10560 [Lentzea aerocolonigenes]